MFFPFDDSSQWATEPISGRTEPASVRRKSLTTRQVSSWFRGAGDRRSVKQISTSHVVGECDTCPRQALVIAVADGRYFENAAQTLGDETGSASGTHHNHHFSPGLVRALHPLGFAVPLATKDLRLALAAAEMPVPRCFA